MQADIGALACASRSDGRRDVGRYAVGRYAVGRYVVGRYVVGCYVVGCYAVGRYVVDRNVVGRGGPTLLVRCTRAGGSGPQPTFGYGPLSVSDCLSASGGSAGASPSRRCGGGDADVAPGVAVIATLNALLPKSVRQMGEFAQPAGGATDLTSLNASG